MNWQDGPAHEKTCMVLELYPTIKYKLEGITGSDKYYLMCDIFSYMFIKNICCWYLLESSRGDNSNEYHSIHLYKELENGVLYTFGVDGVLCPCFFHEGSLHMLLHFT